MRHTHGVSIPKFRFVETSDDVRIAYQRFGSGQTTIVVGEVFNHLAVRWEFPLYRRAFEYLGEHLDVVLYDQRGCGMSDRAEDAMTVQDRMQDIYAILDSENLEQVALIGQGDGAIVAAAFAATEPALVNRLVISNGRVDASTDARAWELAPHPLGITRAEANAPGLGSWNWGTDVADFAAFTTPSLAGDPTVTQWWLRFQQVTLSRDEMIKQAAAVADLDLNGAATRVTAPTLVTHTVGNRAYHIGHARAWAEQIPDATLIEIPGDDHIVEFTAYWRDIYDAQVAFITGTAPASPILRRYAAVLFTDIVESTSESLAYGDERWKSKLDAHDRTTEMVVSEHDGKVIKSTGDGILATFSTPSAAVEAAINLQSGLDSFGMRIRAGIHAGEIEARDSDISGSVVNLAARTMSAASAGEIFITSSVRDQLLGSHLEFTDAGLHELKGFRTKRQLFGVAS
jgi:class 3 adenylate cyclase/pimeloyl-ACP methyl ester carboxylesterase